MLREVINYLLNTDNKTIRADWKKYCALRNACKRAHQKSESAYYRLISIETIPSSEKMQPACLHSRSVMFRDFTRDDALETSYFLTTCPNFNGDDTPCNLENMKCPFFFRNSVYVDAHRAYLAVLQKKRAFVKEVLARQK